MQHLTYVCELHKKQIVLDKLGVVRVVGDQCPFGLWCTDASRAHRMYGQLDEKWQKLSTAHRHCNLFSGGAHTMRIIERFPFGS